MIRLRPTSLHDLARMVEPDLRWHNEATGVSSWTNKWRAYERGERVPRQALVDKVEALRVGGASGAGSKAEFSHLLWQILREPEPTPQTSRRWMHRLDERVLAIASSAPRLSAGRASSYEILRLRSCDYEHLRYLPGLDTVALLTYVMQQAHRFRHEALAHSVGRNLVYALWQLSLRLDDRRLARSFMEYFDQTVLLSSQQGGIRISVGGWISERVRILRRAVSALDQFRSRPEDETDIDVRIRHVLSGRWRPEHREMYMAVETADGHALTDRESLRCASSLQSLAACLDSPSRPDCITQWVRTGWRAT